MGHHIVKGRFQSDKYPDLPPDKVVLSFKDGAALRALEILAIWTSDREFAEDIVTRIRSISKDNDLN